MNCANSDFLNDLRNNKAFLLEVLDQPIVFHKVYKKITGSITAALMLSYATQISDNLEPARGGWFVVDATIWEEETGLTLKEQSTARRNLREFGLLSERKQGTQSFLEIKVNFHRIAELLHDYAKSLPDCAPHAPHPASVASNKKTAAWRPCRYRYVTYAVASETKPGGCMAGSNALFQMWPLLQRNRPISYSSNIAHIVGSVKAAILLSQMIYWTKKGVSVKANDGWFHKQAEHWTMETGLTRHEQDSARKLLVQLEFLEVKHKTADGKKAHGMVSYRINLDRIGQALSDLIGETILAMNPLNLDDLQMDSQIVRQLFGKPVSYHRALVDITGGATSALLLSRMIYLQRRAYSANGGDWFSVTTEFYRQELGMNRRQQESARKALKTNKLIFESLLEDQIRRSRRLYQCVNIPALIPALEKMLTDRAATVPNMPPSPDAAAGATYKTGNLNDPTQVQNRQPETDQGCRKRTRVVAENVHGRLPEMYVYTSEELQGFELQLRTTTTTTTTVDGLNTDVPGTPPAVVVVPQTKEAKADSADGMAALLFPKGIAGQELSDFAKWVKKALPHRRQLLIDEFEYQRKRRIITSPVGYIRKLVERDHEAQGELPLEGAYAVAKNRAAAAAQQTALQVPEAPRTEASIESARREIEQVKALLKSNRRQA